MFITLQDRLTDIERRNLRLLNLSSAIIILFLGLISEDEFRPQGILLSAYVVSGLLILNFALSFYIPFVKNQFTNLSYLGVFLIHFWAIYVTFQKNFDLQYLLPLSISILTFSLIFNKFYKSLMFIFSISTILLVLLIFHHEWKTEHTVTLVTIFTAAILADQIQKRKEDYKNEIQKQELMYTSLLENMNDGMIYIDNQRKIRLVNDAFCRISGKEAAAWTGKSIRDLEIEGKENAGIRKFLANIDSGISDRIECGLITSKSEKIWLHMNGSPFTDESGNKLGYMLVLSDISALKKTQAMLKEKEEGYKTFIEQSAVGIWRAEYSNPISTALPPDEQVRLLLDTGRIAECNEFMAQMYGYKSSSELLGRRIRDFYYIENNFDEEKTTSLMKEFIGNDYRISNAESKELDRNGKIRYMLNNNTGVVEKGMLIRTWGVQTEITDRKQTEKELLESNRELDTFFYKASHDLKGPLASVMGIVNLARLENPDNHLHQYFDLIEKSIRRLDNTLLDLIELARTRKGNSKISDISVQQLVDEVFSSLSHLPRFEKVRTELQIGADAMIRADKILVLSVFQNLIHNAINYGDANAPELFVSCERTADGIQAEVRDNGPGIPETVRDKVFEMFYRGHPDSSGSGLGLFIVKSAIDKMGGKINFLSAENHGTSFYIFIPDTQY
ncbi:MAG: PAS domain S-box protein [Bacteroidetes bacterium]|nr:MAG: PAS domain S-box protein [Bacteroidota bacterium]REK00624.1 MAG: PAS domain S-box protein [Bacteroidota bacterium]REK35254.1 MAG: PAS domain S-box protein [Bacteroidota bacterium]REK48331.1 MAG: PAS domain S-box protein [Bacteroidota bacterium]